MDVKFAVVVLEKQVCQVQRALEIGKDVGTPVILRVQIVRDELSHKLLEKCVDTC